MYRVTPPDLIACCIYKAYTHCDAYCVVQNLYGKGHSWLPSLQFIAYWAYHNALAHKWAQRISTHRFHEHPVQVKKHLVQWCRQKFVSLRHPANHQAICRREKWVTLVIDVYLNADYWYTPSPRTDPMLPES